MWLDKLKIAQDPQTSPERLRELAADPLLRAAVGANANAPEELLVELTADGPDAVLQNPAFGLMLLDEPDLWRRLPGLPSLAASPYCPETLPQWFLRQPVASGFGALRQPLAANLAFPAALRQRVLFSGEAALKLELTADALESSVGAVCASALVALGMALLDQPAQADERLDASAVHALCELGPLAHLCAAAHPSCPDEWLARFHSEDLDPLALARALAGRRRLPTEAWLFLGKQTSPKVLEVLVQNEALPDELLLKLARRPEVWVRDELVRRHAWRIGGLREAFEDSGSEAAQKALQEALAAIEDGRGRGP